MLFHMAAGILNQSILDQRHRRLFWSSAVASGLQHDYKIIIRNDAGGFHLVYARDSEHHSF